MKRYGQLVFIVVLVVVYYFLRRQMGSSRSIEYRGETFHMSKAYASYEEYKDDPNNLRTNEIARIEHAMTNTTLPASFPDFEGFSRGTSELAFPGYGWGALGRQRQSDGSTCNVVSIEIPMRDRDRYFVGRTAGGPVAVIDDFVMSASNEVRSIKIDGSNITYYDSAGKIVRSRKFLSPGNVSSTTSSPAK